MLSEYDKKRKKLFFSLFVRGVFSTPPTVLLDLYLTGNKLPVFA